MPVVLSREHAFEAIARERPAGSCLVCWMRDSSTRVLARRQHATVLLTAYPRRWGHALVIPHQHVTSFRGIDDATYAEVSTLSLLTARAIERTLSPSRCYVASLGAAREDAVASSPHLHVHVLPVYDPADTPGGVLSWDGGVLSGTAQEWSELHACLASSLREEDGDEASRAR